jgi:hypothetical protein
VLFAAFEGSSWDLVVFIEDDGRVAYAYLSREGAIVGDVWSYNRVESPNAPEWEGRPPENTPYLNASEFVCDPCPVILPQDERQLNVEWAVNAEEKRGARIFCPDQLLAELSFCRQAGTGCVRQDLQIGGHDAGPLARVLC